MRIDAQGRVYLWARNNTVVCISTDLKKVLWTHYGAGSAFDVTPDGHTFTLEKNTVTMINPQGEVVRSFDAIKGMAKALAVDQESKTVFVGGVHAQSNLFWPWLVAHDFEGNKRFERWNWSKKDAYTGGTADSHLNVLRTYNGKLYVVGSADGNPTTFEKTRLTCARNLPSSTVSIKMGRANPASSRAHGSVSLTAPAVIFWRKAVSCALSTLPAP